MERELLVDALFLALCPPVPETGIALRVTGCARWPVPKHQFRFSLPLPSSPEGRPYAACRMRLLAEGG